MKLNFKNSNATVILILTEQEKQHGFAFSGKKMGQVQKTATS